jgi:hypothetical protein
MQNSAPVNCLRGTAVQYSAVQVLAKEEMLTDPKEDVRSAVKVVTLVAA